MKSTLIFLVLIKISTLKDNKNFVKPITQEFKEHEIVRENITLTRAPPISLTCEIENCRITGCPVGKRCATAPEVCESSSCGGVYPGCFCTLDCGGSKCVDDENYGKEQKEETCESKAGCHVTGCPPQYVCKRSPEFPC